MKPEERDRITHRTPPGMPEPPIPPGERMGPPMPPLAKPIHIPLVSVTTSPKDKADRAATESLVNQCLREGLYYCPRCHYTTTTPEAIVNHLAEEINKSLATLNEIVAGHEPSNESDTNPTP